MKKWWSMRLFYSDLNWAIQILGGNNDLPYYYAYQFSCIPEFESPMSDNKGE
ncbi:uncharacterized protein Dvar_64220 [Desulfosarcina variabilis str. Montpellier]